MVSPTSYVCMRIFSDIYFNVKCLFSPRWIICLVNTTYQCMYINSRRISMYITMQKLGIILSVFHKCYKLQQIFLDKNIKLLNQHVELNQIGSRCDYIRAVKFNHDITAC